MIANFSITTTVIRISTNHFNNSLSWWH